MDNNKYQYSPLSEPRQIRLLRLHPRASPEDSPLSVDLITVSLDAAPPFEAISYAWGNPLPQEKIRCSGLTAEIGPSLHSALRRFAPLLPESERLVWADALCINQKDAAERSAQVRMMGEIYATAAKTLIWLGEEDDKVTHAMEWLERFGRFASDFKIAANPENTLESHNNYFRRIGDILIGDTTEMASQATLGDREERVEAFRNIWMLIRRPWFTRKWVIQEVAKSEKHGIVLVAGSKSITRFALMVLFLVLSVNSTACTMFMGCWPCDLETQSSKADDTLTITRADKLCFAVDQEEPLLLLLAKTLDFSCTDVRDHIIALLGISTNGSAYEHLIDYDNPITVLSYRLAQECLKDSRELEQLWWFGSILPIDRRQSVYSVSWMPNIGQLPASAHRSEVEWAFNTTWKISQRSNASRGTGLDVSISGTQLRVRGRMVDRLEQLGMDGSDSSCTTNGLRNNAILSNFDGPNIGMDNWLDECQVIGGMAAADEDTYLDALLLRDIFETRPEPIWDVAAVIRDLPAFRRFQKALISAAEKGEYAEVLAAFTPSDLESFRHVHTSIFRMAHRRFARTEHGRLGWAPRAAEAGDIVCVFDGMALPYVVRPIKEKEGVYMLVGECFIPSLLAGQAMDMDGVQSTIIRLE